jgi:hypothetical protein
MRNTLPLAALSLAAAFAAAMVGCTLFPAKTPPTLATTTSAADHDRILWQLVRKQQWSQIPPLLSTTLVWNMDGKSLRADQVVPYLQSLKLTEAAVTEATVEPNGPDMTVAYTLEETNVADSKGCVDLRAAMSVWQQVKGGGYVLIAHSEQAKGSRCVAF